MLNFVSKEYATTKSAEKNHEVLDSKPHSLALNQVSFGDQCIGNYDIEMFASYD